MDGNRRWAKKRGLPVAEGHRRGYENLKKLLYYLREQDVEHVSVYAFSTENWNRSKDEVSGLMKLLRWVMSREVDELMRQERKIVFVGSKEHVAEDILNMIEKTEAATADFARGTLAICFNYGGQQEIIDAAKEALNSGEGLSIESVSSHLYKPELPPLDLIIRTSGEQRISNFMLWQAAYAELAFTETLWPDFTPEELHELLEVFSNRARRYGK